jgi:hypothetical protein
MTALVVGGLVLLVVLAFIWSRIMSARSDRRSMESYGHALGVLGDVARRTERSASVRILPREDAGRTHVRTEVHEGDFPTAVSPTGEHEVLKPGRPKFRVEPHTPGPVSDTPPTTSIPAALSELSFGDHAVAWQPEHHGGDQLTEPADITMAVPVVSRAESPETDVAEADALRRGDWTNDPEAADEVRRRSTPFRSISDDEMRRQALHRRIGTGAAAAVAVIALVVAGLQLTRGPAKSGATGQRSNHHPKVHHHTNRPPPSTAPTTTVPKQLMPTSSSPSLVSFNVPPGSYRLTFTDPGAADSWLGVKQSAQSGIWLWVSTLTPGATQTYTASGPVVVDLGAPKFVSLTVNGIPARLPGYSLPYLVSFTSTPASGSA